MFRVHIQFSFRQFEWCRFLSRVGNHPACHFIVAEYDGGQLALRLRLRHGVEPVAKVTGLKNNQLHNELNGILNSLFWIRAVFWLGPPAPKVLGSDSNPTSRIKIEVLKLMPI